MDHIFLVLTFLVCTAAIFDLDRVREFPRDLLLFWIVAITIVLFGGTWVLSYGSSAILAILTIAVVFAEMQVGPAKFTTRSHGNNQKRVA